MSGYDGKMRPPGLIFPYFSKLENTFAIPLGDADIHIVSNL